MLTGLGVVTTCHSKHQKLFSRGQRKTAAPELLVPQAMALAPWQTWCGENLAKD